MKMKKLLIMLVLLVFVTGICIGGVDAVKNSDGTATLKFHVDSQGGADNTIKLSAAEVKDIQNGKIVAKKIASDTVPAKKVKVKKTGYKKVPVYKYKKVKTSKWVVKKVLTMESWSYYDNSNYEFKDKSYSANKYWNSKKWKYCGASYKDCLDSYELEDESYYHTKYYTHFKQKVTYYKKVKYIHHYKKVKYTYYDYKFYGKKIDYRTAYIQVSGGYIPQSYLLTCNYDNIGDSIFDIRDSLLIEFDLDFNYVNQFWI